MHDKNNSAASDRFETGRPAIIRHRSPAGGGRYEIIVTGHLDEHWTEWLGNLTITHDTDGNTRLSGMILDQAALHGLLVQIRDLGLSLVSLRRLES